MNTLREAVQEYLEVRRSLGFKLREAGKGLIDLVTFLEQHNASYITQALVLAWAQQPANVQPVWWAQRVSFVRGFARFRSATDRRTQIPPYGLLPFHPKRARPYLYSDEEIRKLLRAALRMRCRYERGKLRPWVYYSLLGLLSVSGLRLSEVRNLELQDVDLGAAVLTIRGTKFGKARLVPLHPSTCRVLSEYMNRRRRHWKGRAVSSYLFVSSLGNCLDSGDIHRTFYVLSRQIGLRGSSDSSPLHSGVDIAILALWLGHEHIQTTYIYLQADLTNKENALDKLAPAGEQVARFQPEDDLLAFLARL